MGGAGGRRHFCAGEGEPEVKSPGNVMLSFVGEMDGSLSVFLRLLPKKKQSLWDKESHRIAIKSAARSPVFTPKPNPLNKKKKILLAHFPPVRLLNPLYLPVKMQMWPTGNNGTMTEAGRTGSPWLSRAFPTAMRAGAR